MHSQQASPWTTTDRLEDALFEYKYKLGATRSCSWCLTTLAAGTRVPGASARGYFTQKIITSCSNSSGAANWSSVSSAVASAFFFAETRHPAAPWRARGHVGLAHVVAAGQPRVDGPEERGRARARASRRRDDSPPRRLRTVPKRIATRTTRRSPRRSSSALLQISRQDVDTEIERQATHARAPEDKFRAPRVTRS